MSEISPGPRQVAEAICRLSRATETNPKRLKRDKIGVLRVFWQERSGLWLWS